MPPMTTNIPTVSLYLSVACVCIAASMVPASAVAETDTSQEAVRLSGEAKRAYAAGRFDIAAGLFMQAYAEVPEPTLVFNAARSYQRAGRGSEALPLFRLYLRLGTHDDPDTRAGRRDAHRHIASIEAELRAEEAREAKERAELERKAREANKPPPPMAQPKPKPAPVIAPTLPKNDRKAVYRPDLFQRIRNPKGWTGLETAAVVAGSIGAAALISGLVAHAGNDALDSVDDRLTKNRQLIDGRTLYSGVTQSEVYTAVQAHNSTAVTGNVLVFTGLVAGGVAVWLWTAEDGDSGERISAVPTDGGGLMFVSGRF